MWHSSSEWVVLMGPVNQLQEEVSIYTEKQYHNLDSPSNLNFDYL